MSTANRPAGRSLDRRGGGPDERARPPEELLDNLRLRLSQLAGNHPSAPGYERPRARADVVEPADRARTGAAGQPDADRPDAPGSGDDGRAAAGGGGRVGVFGDQNPGLDAGSKAPADSQTGSAAPGWPADAVRTAAAALASGLGVLATIELPARGRAGDPYRPWFMAGEPGSPWWTGTSY